MCGRYTLRKLPSVEGLDVHDLLAPWEGLERFNVAPTQKIPVVRFNGRPEAAELAWGIRARWQQKTARPLINARSETAAAKPTFRESMARRRCLVPADGFYEWRRAVSPPQPHFFHLSNEDPFWFAGIWENDAYLILTTVPNEVMRPIHDRMPVILDEANAASWLGDSPLDRETLDRLCSPCPAEKLSCREVGRRVNNARFDDPECLV